MRRRRKQESDQVERFVILERGENDIIEDEYALALYRIADTDDVPEGQKPPRSATVAYCRTKADAEFACRLMNVGAMFRKEVTAFFQQVKADHDNAE